MHRVFSAGGHSIDGRFQSGALPAHFSCTLRISAFLFESESSPWYTTAIRLPSAEKINSDGLSRRFLMAWISLPSFTFQKRMVLSFAAEATICPFGEKAT